MVRMSQKEINEARRVRIPESIIARMSQGFQLHEKDKEVIRGRGKVYVAGHRRDGKYVKPQLRDLPKVNNPEKKFGFVYPKGTWLKSGNTISPEDKVVLGDDGQIQLVEKGTDTSMRTDYHGMKDVLERQLKHARSDRDKRWEEKLIKNQKNLEGLYQSAKRNTRKPYKHWEEYRFNRAVVEGHFTSD